MLEHGLTVDDIVGTPDGVQRMNEGDFYFSLLGWALSEPASWANL